jgi:hypothetical protein
VSNAGIGVEGDSVSGTGGHFMSSTGYDALLGQAIVGSISDSQFHGSGRLAMVGRTDVGGVAPNITPFFVTHSTLFAGGHFQHELVRGNDGSIWASTASMVGTNQSRWKRVNAVRVDSSDGGGAPFKPKRVIDTRSGAIKAAGTTTKVTVAGVGTGTSNIPSDAVAVIGNLTAVNYTGGGFLAIMPAGVAFNPAADPSSVNFIVGQKAIANSFVVGLGAGADAGKVQVVVAGHSTHFIIDITGYMQ